MIWPLILDSLIWSVYHATNMPVLVFIRDLVIATSVQMASLFGGIFVLGLLIHFVSRLTFNSIEKAFWSRGTYLVAWLGTPIHELGHALFCLIFMHQIVEIELFKPDPITGTLGYVSHKWNRSNPWQVLGNLFISIGPVILGCAVLFAIFYFLIPNSSETWDFISARVKEINNFYSVGGYFEMLQTSAFSMVRSIFTIPNLTSWRFWVFFYLSICVSSNMRLSLADIKGSLSGFGCLILPFLLINLLGLATGLGNERFFPFTASSLGLVYSLLILALVMAVLGFVLTYLLAAAWVKIRRGHVLNPL